MDLISALIQCQIRLPLEEKNIPKKTINDLQESDFIRFFVEDEIIVARLFGVFRVVFTESFILEERVLQSDIPPNSVYQIQQGQNGQLFLQGIKEKFIYK